jgi:hypothetical protein
LRLLPEISIKVLLFSGHSNENSISVINKWCNCAGARNTVGTETKPGACSHFAQTSNYTLQYCSQELCLSLKLIWFQIHSGTKKNKVAQKSET